MAQTNETVSFNLSAEMENETLLTNKTLLSNETCAKIIADSAMTGSHLCIITGNDLACFANSVRFYGRPFIYVIGLIFNILAICVLRRPSLRKNTTCIFLTGVAVADFFIVLVGFFFWVEYELNYSVMTADKYICKLAVFIIYSAPEISAFLLVSMSAERLIKLRYAMTTPTLTVSAARKVYIFVAAASFLIVAINVHIFFADTFFSACGRKFCWNIYHDSRDLLVNHQDDTTLYFAYANVWVSLGLYWILPLVAFPIINTLIIWEVKRKREPIKKMSVNVRENSNPRRPLTRMLLFVTFAYLLMTSGDSLIQCGIIDIYKETDIEARARLSIVHSFFILLFYLNHAMNFFLYCLSGRRYREEFKDMVNETVTGCFCKMMTTKNPSKKSEHVQKVTTHQDGVTSHQNESTSHQNVQPKQQRHLGAISQDQESADSAMSVFTIQPCKGEIQIQHFTGMKTSEM